MQNTCLFFFASFTETLSSATEKVTLISQTDSLNQPRTDEMRKNNPPHFLYDFSRKTWDVLLTHTIISFSYCLLREILGNVYIAIVCLKSQDKRLNALRMKRVK